MSHPGLGYVSQELSLGQVNVGYTRVVGVPLRGGVCLSVDSTARLGVDSLTELIAVFVRSIQMSAVRTLEIKNLQLAKSMPTSSMPQFLH